MTQSTWPLRRFGALQALWLTLAFWAFAFVVFQAPALKNGGLTMWETVGYVFIVTLGAALSMMLYGVIRLTTSTRLRYRVMIVGAFAMLAAILHSAIDPQIFVASADTFGIAAPCPRTWTPSSSTS